MKDPKDMTPEELCAAFDAWRNPPVRPICSRVNLMDSGNRFIQPFSNGSQEIKPIAAISVYRVSFIPDSPEDSDALLNHVRNALQKLAKTDCEFKSPEPSPATHLGEYKRPEHEARYIGDPDKLDVDEKDFADIYKNAYAYQEGGEVIIQQPMILSDALHVYKALEGVIIPSQETAQQFEQARWNEVRGPLSAADERISFLQRSLAFDAVLPEHQLGCMHNVPEDQLVPTALKHIFSMRVAGQSTDAELAQQVTGLAYATAKGLLTDGSGHYPALPAPHANQSVAAYHAQENRMIVERATSMLDDVLKMGGQEGHADAIAALQNAAETLKPQLDKAMERNWEAYGYQVNDQIDEAQADYLKREKVHGLFPFWKTGGEAAYEAEIAMRKNALDTVLNTNFEAQKIPPFLPRRYQSESYWGEQQEYVSRPAGPIWPPLLELPEDLKSFVQENQPWVMPDILALPGMEPQTP